MKTQLPKPLFLFSIMAMMAASTVVLLWIALYRSRTYNVMHYETSDISIQKAMYERREYLFWHGEDIENSSGEIASVHESNTLASEPNTASQGHTESTIDTLPPSIPLVKSLGHIESTIDTLRPLAKSQGHTESTTNTLRPLVKSQGHTESTTGTLRPSIPANSNLVHVITTLPTTSSPTVAQQFHSVKPSLHDSLMRTDRNGHDSLMRTDRNGHDSLMRTDRNGHEHAADKQGNQLNPTFSHPTSTISQSQADALRHSTTNGGYVLAVNYYEQQSMGSRNMFQLQCWAKSLGLSVVKPVMKDSFLRTPLDYRLQQTMMKFEDSFSLSDWNKYTEQHKYAPLVNWEQFLTKAPKKVIMVLFEYASVGLLKSRHKAGESILHQAQAQRYKNGCQSQWPSSSDVAFLQSRRFKVVRTVCVNFYYGDQLTLDEFNSHLLGEYAPGDVTVIMEMWRGIGTAQRVILKDSCRDVFPVQEYILPSERLVRDAERYIRRYLNNSAYLAVMGRLEMSMLTVHKKVPVVPFCLQETLTQWEMFAKDTHHLRSTFASIDIGRFGTKKFRSKLNPDYRLEFEKFIMRIYGDSMSVRDWETTFEAVSGTRDAGYIGLLQKVIVTRAQCILFVGGGAFQRHALHLYRKLHEHPDNCLRVVKQCTSATKFVL